MAIDHVRVDHKAIDHVRVDLVKGSRVYIQRYQRLKVSIIHHTTCLSVCC